MLQRFTLIAGPCLLEHDGLNVEIGRQLASLSSALGISVVFKASFDKANRSRGDSPRGPGLDGGLEQLRHVREETGLPILTDVHEVDQAAEAARVADILQIPALLCRQTDLLRAAGATGKVVNIKKGQWMTPEEMLGAVEKTREAGAPSVAVTERGTFFGYGDLIVDMRSFQRIREACRVPVIFDGTHSLQRPGLISGSSGGAPEFVPALVRAAVAAGCDGLFLEVHPDPRSAPSDSSSMLPLDELKPLLERVVAIRAALAEVDLEPSVSTG
ncbi:MAG TPA: 3-deoxy-8-phosphooctulonate synthase [Gemmatimonadetes bacterium]|jgi:2-dehydro-3-deoxyphosphooctonate aldolase (KDO 8-P synthase)|nr:3-deoxy-8-phosphooctulonate synthase [Gemmatimonadota bacterium]HAB30705.1 3-deoxy-8-phosphooctulonate synthase [Gemmatimonadota bacterium]